ncbi:MAG: hypothetical protein ACKOEO_04595, partial [Planctomycetaceae bacterium]
ILSVLKVTICAIETAATQSPVFQIQRGQSPVSLTRLSVVIDWAGLVRSDERYRFDRLHRFAGLQGSGGSLVIRAELGAVPATAASVEGRGAGWFGTMVTGIVCAESNVLRD